MATNFKLFYPQRPVVVSISDASDEKAFINLFPFPITVIGKSKKTTVKAPGLVISDGMSIPDMFQSKMQGEDGIVPGHTHDILYSPKFKKQLKILSNAMGMSERRAADYILMDWLEKYAPGYRKIEAKEVYVMVRSFGGFSFQKEERDKWRMNIAEKLGFTIPGKGCGYFRNDGVELGFEIANNLRFRHSTS